MKDFANSSIISWIYNKMKNNKKINRKIIIVTTTQLYIKIIKVALVVIFKNSCLFQITIIILTNIRT